MHDILPFSKYTSERLPPRVRNILESVYQAAWHVLEPVLQQTLAEYEQSLFKRADKARNHQEQNDQFIAMREVRKRSTEMQVAIRDVLQQRLVALVTSDRSAAQSSAEARAVLQLVDSEDLEESLILSEFTAKAEMRYAAGWHALSYRFAAIAAAPPLEVELLPIGPQALADALRAAGRRLDLPVAAKVDCYRHVEMQLLNALGPMLKGVNDDLIAHRVLAHLHVPRPRGVAAPIAAQPGKPDVGADRQDPESSASASEAGRPDAASAEPGAPAAPMGAEPHTSSASHGQPAWGQPQSSDSIPLSGAFAPMSGSPMSAEPRPAAPGSTAPAPSGPADTPRSLPAAAGPALKALDQLWGGASQAPDRMASPMAAAAQEADQAELFTTLRELLAGRRTQRGDRRAGPQAAARSVAPQADVQGVLTVLQGQPVAPRMVDGRWQPRRVADIKQDMLNQLRSLGDGAPARLSEEDEDTVDLVGLLFDQLGDGLSPVSLSNNLLTKLQVPVLKVALRDKAFFTRRKHPARMLLNEVAEAAALWVEDEEADKPVLDKMQLVVDRVLRDYDQDDQLFDDLLGDLGSHLNSVRRKADIAEKRQIDAARGREKMDLSRAAAVEAIEQLLSGREAPEALRSFLLEAWTDVLALSLLRQGPQGEDFRHELELAEELLELLKRDSATTAARKARFEGVAEELRDGVAAVGMTPEAFQKVRTALVGALALDEPDEPKPKPEDLQETLKARPRLGGDQGGDKPATILSHLRGNEHWNLSPEELAMCDRIKQLPFGTWFEFTRNQQGDKLRRKLSWFSPVTGRCLFVNARGAKVEDRTISALARDLVRGTARVVVEHRERLIDRAWKAIMSAFKSSPRDPDIALESPEVTA
jgi:hypothetical protein